MINRGAFGVLSASFGILFFSLVLDCYTHINMLYHVVSGASFLTEGELECNIAHRRSVAAISMLYRIRCNSEHHLYGDLPVPYVPVLVTLCASVAHHNIYAPPHCRTSQYRRTFIEFSVSLWKDLGDSVFEGVGLAVFRAGPMPLFWLICALSFFVFYCFLFLFFTIIAWYCGAWVFGLTECLWLSPALQCQQFLPIIIKQIIATIGISSLIW